MEERDDRLNTMGQIKHRHTGNWFDRDTLRWWSSRVSDNVYPTGITALGTLFVTSEKEEGKVRLYTVRRATLNVGADGMVLGCSITTEGEFQGHRSSNQAHRVARRIRDEEQKLNRPEWFVKE